MQFVDNTHLAIVIIANYFTYSYNVYSCNLRRAFMLLQMFGKTNFFLSQSSGASNAGPREKEVGTYGPYGHAINPAAAFRRTLPPWWPDDATSTGSASVTAAGNASVPAAGASHISRPQQHQKQRQLPQPTNEEKLRDAYLLPHPASQKNLQQRQQQQKQEQQWQKMELQRQQQLELQLQRKQQIELQKKQQEEEEKLRQQQHQLQQMEQQKKQLQLQRQQVEQQQRNLQMQQERLRREQQEQQMQQQRELQKQQRQLHQQQHAYQQELDQMHDYDPRQLYHCTLCNLQFSSPGELQVHKLESTEHRSNQKMLICREECQRVYGVVTDHRLMQFLLHFCHSCCMAFENEVQLARHTASSVHLAATGVPQASFASTVSAAAAASFDSLSAQRADHFQLGGLSHENKDRMLLSTESIATSSGISGYNNSLFGSRPIGAAFKASEPNASTKSRSRGRRQHKSPPRKASPPTRKPSPPPPRPPSKKAHIKPSTQPKPFKPKPPLPPSKAHQDSKPVASANSLLGTVRAPSGKKRPSDMPPPAHSPPKRLLGQKPGQKFIAHCSICKVNINSEASSNEHFNGKRHALAVAAAAGGASTSASPDEDLVQCETCQINVRRQNLVSHRMSKEHAQKLAKIGAEMMKLVSH